MDKKEGATKLNCYIDCKFKLRVHYLVDKNSLVQQLLIVAIISVNTYLINLLSTWKIEVCCMYVDHG